MATGKLLLQSSKFRFPSDNPSSQNTPSIRPLHKSSFRNHPSKFLSDNTYSQNALPISPLHKLSFRNHPSKFRLFTASATPTSSLSTDPGPSPPVEVEWRRVLSEELSRSKNVVRLSCDSTVDGGSCVVYLVGTCHVSTESANEVQAIINYLKPQVVFLELCADRALTNWKFEVPKIEEMVNETRNKQINALGMVWGWLLSKVADELGVIPGSEFFVAYEEAMKYGGTVFLGDRPVDITFRRTWEKMPFWHKVKLISLVAFVMVVFKPLMKAMAERIDSKTTVNYMNDIDGVDPETDILSEAFPTVMETLVNERDRYMAYELLRVASKNCSVVAIVGRGHLQGMKKHWQQQPINIKEIMQVLPEKPNVVLLGVAYAVVRTILG